MVSVIMRTYERWGIEIDINWIRLSSCAAFDFGCSCEWELSLWEANRQSNRARSSKRSLVNIGYEKQRITHRKCEIWARVSEIEWQNIWGQSCCSAIHNMTLRKMCGTLLLLLSTVRDFRNVILIIDFFFWLSSRLSSSGPQIPCRPFHLQIHSLPTR